MNRKEFQEYLNQFPEDCEVCHITKGKDDAFATPVKPENISKEQTLEEDSGEPLGADIILLYL